LPDRLRLWAQFRGMVRWYLSCKKWETVPIVCPRRASGSLPAGREAPRPLTNREIIRLFCDHDAYAMGWYFDNTQRRPHRLTPKNNDSWSLLYDMHGNVSEWCKDAIANTCSTPRGPSWAAIMSGPGGRTSITNRSIRMVNATGPVPRELPLAAPHAPGIQPGESRHANASEIGTCPVPPSFLFRVISTRQFLSALWTRSPDSGSNAQAR
jgi:hypothetical protein